MSTVYKWKSERKILRIKKSLPNENEKLPIIFAIRWCDSTSACRQCVQSGTVDTLSGALRLRSALTGYHPVQRDLNSDVRTACSDEWLTIRRSSLPIFQWDPLCRRILIPCRRVRYRDANSTGNYCNDFCVYHRKAEDSHSSRILCIWSRHHMNDS